MCASTDAKALHARVAKERQSASGVRRARTAYSPAMRHRGACDRSATTHCIFASFAILRFLSWYQLCREWTRTRFSLGAGCLGTHRKHPPCFVCLARARRELMREFVAVGFAAALPSTRNDSRYTGYRKVVLCTYRHIDLPGTYYT